jgi:glutamate racemase
LIKNRLLCDKISHNITRIECFVSGQNAVELQPVVQHLMSSQLTWTINNLDEV